MQMITEHILISGILLKLTFLSPVQKRFVQQKNRTMRSHSSLQNYATITKKDDEWDKTLSNRMKELMIWEKTKETKQTGIHVSVIGLPIRGTGHIDQRFRVEIQERKVPLDQCSRYAGKNKILTFVSEFSQPTDLNQITFKDPYFHPDCRSLKGIKCQQKQQYQTAQWRKLSDIYGNNRGDYKLSVGGISPSDIFQGQSNNCYVLAALAALAQRKDRIIRLFHTRQIDNRRFFRVQLIFMGKWITIDLDEYVPVDVQNNELYFCKTQSQEIWVVLLEKAFAKLYGSYYGMDNSGYPYEGLHTFSGSPSQIYIFAYINRDTFWNSLRSFSLLEYSMVLATNQVKPGTNLVHNHAYTLLNSCQIIINNKLHRIVQIRNPYGHKEGNLDWKDTDNIWKKFTQQQKQQIGYSDDPKDGIFFISYEDMFEYFYYLTVSLIDDNASYVYASAIPNYNETAYFKVTTYSKADYWFELNQIPERLSSSQEIKHQHIPEAKVHIMNTSTQSISELYKQQEVQYILDTHHLRTQLEPGTYIVKVKKQFERYYPKAKKQITLSCYSNPACFIQVASRSQAQQFEQSPFNSDRKGVFWTDQQVSDIQQWPMNLQRTF